MRRRFKYKEENGRFFPIIEVILRVGRVTLPPLEALVDSGASRSSFDGSVAKALNLPLVKKRKRKILTAAGPALETFTTHQVKVNFAQNPLPRDMVLEIDFISKLQLLNHPHISLELPPFGILGHHNFFDIWKVAFDTPQGELELISHSPKV